jgi:hypothetical protein
MSANTTTAMHGQSSHVGLLGAAAVLTAVVAAGAVGIVIGTGVRPLTVDAPVAGPVIDSTSMSGPRTGVQKGLGNAAPVTSGVDGRFAAQYDRWLAGQQAAAIAAQRAITIADPKETGASIALPGAAAYGGSDFAGQYEVWAKAQSMAAGSDFPDLYQRLVAAKGAAYGGSDFAGQYEAWAKAQAAAAGSDFPDLYQRLMAVKAAAAYGGSDFAAQYEAWLAAQAAASSTSFPDYFQRHAAPATTIDLSKFRGINLTDPIVAPADVVNGSDFATYLAFLIARAAAAQGQVDNEADLAARLMAAQAPATSPAIHRNGPRFLRPE